ncbi:cell wall protein DAN4-like [Oryzias latipes]|uniref:cell wall protein DAN4-like n=1 Tax=Oryzias latipes TaxID=8090 RepID=UPI000CE1CE21|nr:cell wall protein DAN4-like [Oryzias latipes]
MKLIFSLTLIYALCSSAAALQCDACADAACSTTFSKNCSSGTLCVTASITASSPGASGTRVYKDCAAPSLCPMAGAATFSVNLGYSSAIASAQCCNSDNCNSQTLAFPTPPSANGLTCPGCDPPTSQCSSTVQCSGDQTSCFQATLNNGSTSYPALGCVSPNTCAAATGLGRLPFMENVGDITPGPVCSAATSITTTVQPTTSTTQATTTAATAPATSSTSTSSETTSDAASTSTTPETTTVAPSTSTAPETSTVAPSTSTTPETTTVAASTSTIAKTTKVATSTSTTFETTTAASAKPSPAAPATSAVPAPAAPATSAGPAPAAPQPPPSLHRLPQQHPPSLHQ